MDGNVASTSCEQSNMSPETGKEKRGKLLDYLEEKGELDDEEDDGDFNEEHEKYKLKYYREKFQRTDDDKYGCSFLAFKGEYAVNYCFLLVMLVIYFIAVKNLLKS